MSAYLGGMNDQDAGLSVFVGDLSPAIDSPQLEQYFATYYASVRGAKVITDPATMKSKGFGFVRFGDATERDRALVEMNGQPLDGRSIRVSLATARRQGAPGMGGPPLGAPMGVPSSMQAAPTGGELDGRNTTLFIGGLSANVTEQELRNAFAPFGDIVYVKIPMGKGCGFVQYVERPAAERAMATMHGQVLGYNPVRISWGRSSNRPPHAMPTGAPTNGGALTGAYNAYGAPASTAGYTSFGGASQFGGATNTQNQFGTSYGSGAPSAASNASSFYGNFGNGLGALGGLGATSTAEYNALAATALLSQNPGLLNGPNANALLELTGGLSLGGLGTLSGLGNLQQSQLRDNPLAPTPTDTLNNAFMQTQQPSTLGSSLLPGRQSLFQFSHA